MSYTYSNEIKYADTANLDAFGRLRVSEITTLLDIKHLYDKLPLLVDEELGGTAISTWSDASVLMGTLNSGDYVVRQTIKAAPYQSGKSQLFEASFSGFAPDGNTIKRVGYFTSVKSSPFNSSFDGFFLESNGNTGVISFQIWKGGTSILSAPSTSWLSTDYDAALIDWTKTQLMLVDFQWLGVGRLRFYMVIDGIPRLFWANVGMNNLAGVYMDNSNKPIRYEIRQTGGTPGSFRQICAGVSMEGSINSLYHSTGINALTQITLPTSGVTYPILGIRPQLIFGVRREGISAAFSQVDVLQTTNDNYLVTLQISPTLSQNSAWNSITNAPIQYAQSPASGLTTVTSPGFIISNFMGKGGALASEKMSMDDNVFSLGYTISGNPTEWWICITPLSNNSKFYVGGTVKYYE